MVRYEERWGDIGEIWRLCEEGAPRLEGLAEQLQQHLAQRRVSPAQQRQHRGREIARRPQLQHTRRVGEGCGQQARLASATSRGEGLLQQHVNCLPPAQSPMPPHSQ